MVTQTETNCEGKAALDGVNVECPGGDLSPTSNVKIAMLKRGLTPEDLARALGISVGYVRHLIGGSMATRKGREKIEGFFGQKFWNAEEQS